MSWNGRTQGVPSGVRDPGIRHRRIYVKRKGWVALAIVAVLSALIAAAGGTGRAAHKATLKMAVVTDVGGLNDHSFNQAMNAGRLRVHEKLGFQMRVYDTPAAAERLPKLDAATQIIPFVFSPSFFTAVDIRKVPPNF